MENILQYINNELVFASSDSNLSRAISLEEEKGKLRNIAPRVYTTNFKDKPEAIITRNLFQILSHFYPDALLSHRSALEFKPTSSGLVFLTYTYTKKIKLPGVTLSFLKGEGAIEGDLPMTGNLLVSQKERAILENLQVSKRPGADSKTLILPEIEEKLEQIIRLQGEEGLNKFRDKARIIANKLNFKSEFEKLNKLIGALLNTKPTNVLKSSLAKARTIGLPYDQNRIELFEKLFVVLKQKEFPLFDDKNTSRKSFKNFAFFESYFSNYIEGTVFEIEDAKNMIRTQIPMETRDEDSHDVLGTYQIVSDVDEMSLAPENAEQLFRLLQSRHKILLSARPKKNPGMFKDKNNRAGNTFFVDFNLVRGTLAKGFEYYPALDHPFAKAIYMMFLVSEVHPFLDGNGRIARVMMNAELTKAGQSKIIIPTVFREDYMGALKKMTRQKDCETYIRMMLRAWEFSKNIHGNEMDEMEDYLKATNAFLEPDEGMLKRVER